MVPSNSHSDSRSGPRSGQQVSLIEGTTDQAGTIDQVSQRLLLWARRDDKGLARVEYASEFSRRELLQRLKSEGVLPIEINLPTSQTAAETVSFLLQQLADIAADGSLLETSGGVVSVSGFAKAFQLQSSLADSLRILNFNREALTAFPLQQIWWMTPVLLDTSLHVMPDMHGWFNPQLSLTEVIAASATSGVTVGATARRERSSYSNIDDARQRSCRLLAELDAALESDASEVALVATYLIPALEAMAEVGARQELRELTVQYEELLNRFYSMNNTEVLAALNSEEALGEKALGFARSLDRLVTVFYEQGLYAEAERLCVRALEIYRAELGERHLSTSLSLNNLALLYKSQERYSEAEPLYIEALEIRKAELGDHHLDTATSLNNLALLYESQRRYGEAEPLLVKALEISKAELGDRHSSTATSLFNLAALYHNTQRHQQALDYIHQASNIYIPTLGADHPTTQAANSWLRTIREAIDKLTGV
ncbi:MAG: tetratricopeptide repeat protein [Cyanobacteria bacterium P01_D01_bin.1]